MNKKEPKRNQEKQVDRPEKSGQGIADGAAQPTDEDVLTNNDPVRHIEEENERPNGDLPK